MFFYLPTKIYCEQDCVTHHAEELASLGSKAMIVTGRHSSRQNGSLDHVTEALSQTGTPYVLFDQIEENPSVETVMKARDIGLAEKVDFVIGIGGGSPLDASKAVALMIRQHKESGEFLYTTGTDEALPVAAVPTTCGTGSEATPWAILTRHEKRIKGSISHKIFPTLALSDPGYLRSAPMSVLISTSIDACSHCIESFLNTKATVYSRMLSLQGLTLWRSAKDILTREREASMEDLENMMNASTLAGMAISHTTTSVPHGLSYYLTYENAIPHGMAVGRFLPAYLAGAVPKDSAPLLSAMGFTDLPEFTEWIHRLAPVEVPASTRERAIEGILSNPAKLANCPYPITENLLRQSFFA